MEDRIDVWLGILRFYYRCRYQSIASADAPILIVLLNFVGITVVAD